MNDLKRNLDRLEDAESPNGAKRIVGLDGHDVGVLGDVADLSWPEVFDSILQPRHVATAEGDHDQNSLSGELAMTDNIPIATAASGAADDSSEAADVSLCIQEWTDSHLAHDTVQHVAETVPPANSQELTAQNNATTPTQCFGMISASAARLLGDMAHLHSRLTGLSTYIETLSLQIKFADHFFSLCTPDGLCVGQLNDILTNSLSQIVGLPSIQFEAFTSVKDALQCINRAKRLHESVIKVDINIYGEPNIRDKIGRILSRDKVWLQNPRHRVKDFDHDNPHMLKFPGLDLDDTGTTEGESQLPAASMKQSDAVRAIRQYETRDRGLQGLKHDVQVTAKLLPHQDQALEFMVQREVGPIPLDFQLWQLSPEEGRSGSRHKVTGCWTANPSPETGGGLLADDMGMGKTLSTLSLISQRLSDGWEWSQSNETTEQERERVDHASELRSRATLVVVSSLLIMNGWFKEIEDRLDGSLKVLKYHGKGRLKDAARLADSDIVLTTYHTLAAEHKTKRATLTAVKWFRMVLDEAHTIRRQATGLFAAASEIDSCHRWCLSGTPIQNKLDDLGALLAFIRFDPFDKTSMFRKYIIMPASDDLQQVTKRLTTLLDAVCLRRSITRLGLRPLEERICRVVFSPEERSHYDETLSFMQHHMSYGSREDFAKTPFGRFQIQLQLRILCNHGTFQRPYRWGESDRQTQREDAISSMGKDGEICCSGCRQTTLILKTNCAASRSTQSSSNVLCDECIAQIPPNSTELDASSSPTREGGLGLWPRGEHMFRRPTRALTFNDGGHSAKMEALVSDVKEGLSSTKSIIFSCWTRSLNLIRHHLDRELIKHARIDGDTPLNQRQQILDKFSQSSEVRVLLMTTGTGAYGLNLAVANRVFILEPQWNPSIESQAVARVQRFLQTQTVQVTRYAVEKTVEDDILRQQYRKKIEAEMGFRSA